MRENGNMMTGQRGEAAQEYEVEVLQPTALEAQERAQIDIQISTAKRYPRQLSLVKQRMMSYATLDEETAAGCFYTLPGRKGGDGKPLQGPSVRLAEIALASYQHLCAGSRIISDDGKFITAQGVVHDLENNVRISIEVKRRVTTKSGERYSDDMIATTGNAACSIALRNAAFRVIPLALVKPVYEAAKRLAIGDAKSLVQRRAACLEHFAKLGISKERVCAAVECRASDDIQIEHLETLMGYATAIKDGETTIDAVFPEPAVKMEEPDIGGKSRKAKPAEETKPAEPADASNEDLNGDPKPNREPPAVDNMSKSDLLKEILPQANSEAFFIAMSEFPEGTTPSSLPLSSLRGVAEELRLANKA